LTNFELIARNEIKQCQNVQELCCVSSF